MSENEADAKESGTKIQNRFPMSASQLLDPAIPDALDFSVIGAYELINSFFFLQQL